jgi:FkbM family methyltransferase
MRALKSLGFNPRTILDIGAYHGSWSEVMWHVWPDAQYHLVEGNEECRYKLSETGFSFDIALLSDQVKEVIYHKSQTGSGEGNSMYPEKSVYPFSPEVVRTQRLDNLLSGQTFDLVKIDAQGSELDIVRGGLDLIGRTMLVQLECQVQTYNAGAPTAAESIIYMDSIGFRLYDITEYHLNSRQMLIQADFLFARKDSGLFDLQVLS